MIIAILVLGLLAAAFGLLLGYAAVRFKVESDPVSEMVDKLLPQTQCGQCGFAGCRPYAEAVAAGEADIDHCVQGGEGVVRALADLLGKEVKPKVSEDGASPPKLLAVINEQLCIGCTLCIQACPVDAIIGAPKHMHTVIAKECTGCELCVPVCPIDCIRMMPIKAEVRTWKWPHPEQQTSLIHEA
jgi:electron transport complex protein RnfB